MPSPALRAIPRPVFFLALAFGIALSARAEPVPTPAPADAASAEAAVVECLGEIGIVALDVAPSPVAGLYEAELEGGAYLHVTDDGCGHLLVGDLYERRGDQIIPVTERKRTAKQRAKSNEALARVPESEMIVFAPETETRAVVVVFTDTDCGYCRQLHAALDDYHALGIEVRYLAFPRAGANSATYDKMVSAWCADDPKAALAALKRGEGLPAKTCDHPVGKQYAIGQEIGVTGTPAIVLEDGTLLPGFLEADALARHMGL